MLFVCIFSLCLPLLFIDRHILNLMHALVLYQVKAELEINVHIFLPLCTYFMTLLT